MTNSSKSPRISVIMPAYNSEKYISEAIRSILEQTYTDFEFIILNDGSTDNTAEIIKTFSDPRIKFINNQTNQGFIASLNQCIDEASGEFIAKMDSDDISLPTRLEKQISYLDAHPNVGMVGCAYQEFDQGNKIIVHPAKIGLLDMLRYCATTIFLVRKQILDTFGLRFRKEYPCAEDYDFYARFIRYADIHNLQEVLYLYRWHGENVSIRKREIQIQTSQKVQQNLLNYLTPDSKTQQQIETLFSSKKKIYYLFNFIPLLKVKKSSKHTKYYLFCFLPILKEK